MIDFLPRSTALPAPEAPTPPSPDQPGLSQPAPGLRHVVVMGGLLVAVEGLFVLALLLAARVGGWRPDAGTLTLVLLGGLTLIAAAVVWLVVGRSTVLTARSLGFRRPTLRLLHLLWQIPVVFIVAIAVSGIVLTVLLDTDDAGGVSGTTAQLQDLGGGALTVVVLWLLVAVVTPVWEEVLFRGILFQALADRMPWLLAALIGAAVFAAVHIAPPVLAYVFVLGLACCMLFRFHGNLWAPIVLHVVNNSIVVLAAAATVWGGAA